MNEVDFNGVFGPRPTEEQGTAGGEVGDSFWRAFKVNFMILGLVVAAYVLSLFSSRFLPFLSPIAIAGIFIIIGGLPALGVLNFIIAGVQKSKGKSNLAKGYSTCGVISLLLYGGCWVLLFGVLGNL